MNVKVIPVKAFPGPQGGAFKRPVEGGQVAQFNKGLTHVQITGARRPVVISGLTVGDHDFEAGRCPVIQGLLMFKIHFNIGIGLVSQAANSPTGFPCWRHVGSGFGAGAGVIHYHAGAGVAVELKPAFLIGFFLQFGGTLSHFLSAVLGFLLLCRELLYFLLCRLCAGFCRLRSVFGIL